MRQCPQQADRLERKQIAEGKHTFRKRKEEDLTSSGTG